MHEKSLVCTQCYAYFRNSLQRTGSVKLSDRVKQAFPNPPDFDGASESFDNGLEQRLAVDEREETPPESMEIEVDPNGFEEPMSEMESNSAQVNKVLKNNLL